MPVNPYALPRPEDEEPSPEELQAARTAGGAQQNASTWGSGIGAALGAVGGGIVGTLIEPGGGTLAGAGLGASVGGTLGNAIGSSIGTSQANAADDTLMKDQLARQRRLTSMQLREEALQHLLAEAQ